MSETGTLHDQVDMSPSAVAQRLRDLQQLYLFAMSLSRVRFANDLVGAVSASEKKTAADTDADAAKARHVSEGGLGNAPARDPANVPPWPAEGEG